MRRSHVIFNHLRSKLPTFFVAYFLAIFNISTAATPLAAICGFGFCFALYHRELYYFAIKNKIVISYMVVILASAIWSLVPSKSLWYGIELCLSISAAILMGISATPRQIARGIFGAMAIVIIASLISGRQGPSAAGYVLIGVTGSKTTIGIVAVMLVGSGMAILFERQEPLVIRLATLPFIPLGAYIATHVEAATAKVSVAAVPIAFLGFLALRHLSLFGRWALVAIIFVIALPLSVAISQVSQNADEKILQALNKDATLSGRTLIWDKADQWIENSPVLGYGYRSFWLSESSDSVGILHRFGLTDSRVFEIHNTIKETLLDTGWLGLTVFLGTVIIFSYYVLAFVFISPSASSAFLAVTYLMMIAHMPVETLVGIFFPPTILFYLCGTAGIVFFMNRTLEGKDQSAPNGHDRGRRLGSFAGEQVGRRLVGQPPIGRSV